MLHEEDQTSSKIGFMSVKIKGRLSSKFSFSIKVGDQVYVTLSSQLLVATDSGYRSRKGDQPPMSCTRACELMDKPFNLLTYDDPSKL